MSHDLVIRKGNIADGRGSPLYQADIAINDGVISRIGNISERGREELDARGLLVAPGWVDIHSHYDGQAFLKTDCYPRAGTEQPLLLWEIAALASRRFDRARKIF